MNATTYGLDVAKRVFQLYWVEAHTGEIVNRRFGRDDPYQTYSDHKSRLPNWSGSAFVTASVLSSRAATTSSGFSSA